MTGHEQVLVTGGTGFIGSALCRALLERGISHRLALRRPYNISPATPCYVLGDFDDKTIWSDAVRGTQMVIHLAGAAHSQRPAAHSCMRSNAEATKALSRAALREGIRRFVFLSTAKVNGETSPPGGFREDDEPNPHGDYAQSKYLAEEHLRAASNEGLAATIIRAPLVYGPGVKANFLALMRALDHGLPLPLGGITENLRSLVYVDNLVDAILWIATNPSTVGETYFVSDGNDLSTAALARAITAALERKLRLFSMPRALLKAAATVAGCRQALLSLTETLTVDTSKLRLTGWRPQFSMPMGLDRTADWFHTRRS